MTRTAKKTTEAPAKKTAAKRATTTAAAARPARNRVPRKNTAGAPKLSLVKTRPDLPIRKRLVTTQAGEHIDDFIPETHIHATHAARLANIPTHNIRNDWHDHWDGTATRRLRDGSLLHYDLNTRTLTWQAACRMGAIHQYQLTSPSMACAARLHADGCTAVHADLTKFPALTPDELEALGLLQTPTWAGKDPIGDAITDTKVVVSLPDREPRALGDELTRSGTGTADTQSMSFDEIGAHIAEQLADTEAPKEHPQP